MKKSRSVNVKVLELRAKNLEKLLAGAPKYKQKPLEGTDHVREFIAYENSDGEQLYRLELSKFSNSEITSIIRKVNYWKDVDTIKAPAYKNFKSGDYDFGRLRIGDFRIFVHRSSPTKWIMLHVYRKTTDSTPESETLIALKRLREYKSQ